MKKYLFGIVMILGLLGFSQAATIDQAVTWMNENSLTIFKTVTDYKPNNYIRRDEAAKLFVKFAQLQNKATYVKNAEECKFSDLNDAHQDLKDIIVESCKLGIFQGANGKFMPKWSLTNEQAVAVLLRVVGEKQSEVGVSSWSENYYNRANEMLLFIDTPNMLNKKGLATRGDTAMGIYFMNYLNKGSNIIESKKLQLWDDFSFEYPSDGIDGPRQDATFSNFSHSHEGHVVHDGERQFNVSKSLFNKKTCEDEMKTKFDVYYDVSTSLIDGKKVYSSPLLVSSNGTILCFNDENKIATEIVIGIDSSEYKLKNQILNTLQFN